MLDPALNSGVTESLNGNSGAVCKEEGGTGVASDGSRREDGCGDPGETPGCIYVRTYVRIYIYMLTHPPTHPRRTRRMSTKVVVSRAFFLFFPCNHIINIKKKSFPGEVKDSVIFPLYFLLHKTAKPIHPPDVHPSIHPSAHLSTHPSAHLSIHPYVTRRPPIHPSSHTARKLKTMVVR
jgi:hypothetical protein